MWDAFVAHPGECRWRRSRLNLPGIWGSCILSGRFSFAYTCITVPHKPYRLLLYYIFSSLEICCLFIPANNYNTDYNT